MNPHVLLRFIDYFLCVKITCEVPYNKDSCKIQLKEVPSFEKYP